MCVREQGPQWLHHNLILSWFRFSAVPLSAGPRYSAANVKYHDLILRGPHNPEFRVSTLVPVLSSGKALHYYSEGQRPCYNLECYYGEH